MKSFWIKDVVVYIGLPGALVLGLVVLALIRQSAYFSAADCYTDTSKCKFQKAEVIAAVTERGVKDPSEADVKVGDRSTASGHWTWEYNKATPDTSCPITHVHVEELQMDPASGEILYFSSACLPVQSNKIQLHAAYLADFSDDRVLMGASHTVFVGKVVNQLSNTDDLGIGPETQFDVQVVENIKGNLNGDVIVDQIGGYKDGILHTVEDSSPSQDGIYLLQPGSTYLFATRYNAEKNWYTLNSYPTASKLLNTDANISDSDAKALADSDVRVQQLKAAYPDEILLPADVAHNNTLNSYASVQAAQAEAPQESPPSPVPATPSPADASSTDSSNDSVATSTDAASTTISTEVSSSSGTISQ